MLTAIAVRMAQAVSPSELDGSEVLLNTQHRLASTEIANV